MSGHDYAGALFARISGGDNAVAMQHSLLTTTDMPADTPARIAELEHGQTADVRGEIGSGGMATVYDCTFRSRAAAMKVMKSCTETDIRERRAAQLRKEQAILAMLDHPHIPRMLAAGTFESDACFIMDRIRGVNMGELLDWSAGRGLRADILQRTAYDCARILSSVHGNGIAHGDVKPGNIMLGAGRDDAAHLYPWLVDFNLSRPIADNLGPLQRREDSPFIIGTPAYLDPFMEKDPQNDVFGFGATMYHAWKGNGLMPHRITWVAAQANPGLFVRSIEDRLHPAHRSERRWADLLKAILCREPALRPGLPEIEDRLVAMGATRGRRAPAPETCDLGPMLRATVEPVPQARSSHRRALFLVLSGTGLLAATAGLICGKMYKDGQRAGEALPADIRPEAPMAVRYPAAEAIFRQPRTGETFRSSAIADPHRMRVIDLTTDELVVLLEEGKPGLSAGLPRRTQYPASLYTLRPGAGDEESLLQLTRGVYHRSADVTTFYPLSQIGGSPAAEKTRRFIAEWKKIDGGSADPKVLDRLNDRLRELRNAAGVK